MMARGGFWAAAALVPVLAFVAMMNPNGPLRGTRSPDPLPLPDATAGGLAATIELNFGVLRFAVPDENRTTQSNAAFLDHAPAAIKALHGRRVQISGYMIPIDMEGWNVRRCVIVPSQANCCYGVAPRFCEFIVATMTGDEVKLALDVPVTFTGTMHVGGDVADEAVAGSGGGDWAAFYTLDCVSATR